MIPPIYRYRAAKWSLLWYHPYTGIEWHYHGAKYRQWVSKFHSTETVKIQDSATLEGWPQGLIYMVQCVFSVWCIVCLVYGTVYSAVCVYCVCVYSKWNKYRGWKTNNRYILLVMDWNERDTGCWLLRKLVKLLIHAVNKHLLCMYFVLVEHCRWLRASRL